MGAWIEMIRIVLYNLFIQSHPTMGAWIEIELPTINLTMIHVAPHDGCVD